MNSKNKDNHDIKYYIKRYINELIEAFIALLVVYLLSPNKNIDTNLFIRNIFIFAFVTLLVEEYNPEYSSNIKQGMTFTIGSNLLSS